MKKFDDIVAQVCARCFLDPDIVSFVCRSFVEIIVDELFRGEDVKLRGLGTLYWHRIQPRTYKHPKTRQLLQTAGRLALRFKPSKDLQLGLLERRKDYPSETDD